MPTKDEQTYPGDVIVYEEDNRYSREVVTIASGSGVVKVGHVIGKITASEKHTPTDPTAVDGSEVADAVCLEEVDATSADKEAVALVRHAQVNRQNLVFDASIDTAGERQTAVDELAAEGIIALEGA